MDGKFQEAEGSYTGNAGQEKSCGRAMEEEECQGEGSGANHQNFKVLEIDPTYKYILKKGYLY